MRAPTRAILDDAIAYIYAVGVRLDQDRQAVESRTLALRILSLAKQGTPDLNYASFLAFGCNHERYLTRTAERNRMLQDEFNRLIPDFDPTREAYNENGSE